MIKRCSWTQNEFNYSSHFLWKCFVTTVQQLLWRMICHSWIWNNLKTTVLILGAHMFVQNIIHCCKCEVLITSLSNSIYCLRQNNKDNLHLLFGNNGTADALFAHIESGNYVCKYRRDTYICVYYLCFARSGTQLD